MNRLISLFKKKPLPEYKILANKVLQALEAVTYAFGLSKKDVKKMWKIFDSMDASHTGLVDASFVGALLNASTLPYVRRMLLFYNWDHTGLVFYLCLYIVSLASHCTSLIFVVHLPVLILSLSVSLASHCTSLIFVVHLIRHQLFQGDWIFLNI